MVLTGFEDPKLNGTFKIVDIPTSKSVSVEIGTARNLNHTSKIEMIEEFQHII